MDDDFLLDDYNPFSEDAPTETNRGTGANDDQDLDDLQFDPLGDMPESPAKRGRAQDDSEEAAKPRRKFKKLDETVLLSEKGLPKIRYEAPWLQFSLENEEEDLVKLIDFYQSWAADLYPRLGFKDFSRAIMSSTGRAKCQAQLARWQAEDKEKRAALSGETVQDEEDLLDADHTQAPEDNGITDDMVRQIQEARELSENDSDSDDEGGFGLFLQNVRARTVEDIEPAKSADESEASPQNADLERDEATPMDTRDETETTRIPNTTSNESESDDDEGPLFLQRRPRQAIEEDLSE